MAENKGPISITITPASIVYAVVIGLIVWVLFYLKHLVLIVLTAIVLASVMEPGITWFTRRRIPRVAAVIILYLIIFGFLFGIAYLMLPPVLEESTGFVSSLPNYLNDLGLSTLISQDLVMATQRIVAGGPSLANTLFDLQSLFTSTSAGALRAVSGVFGGFFSFFLILIMSVYFAVQETGIDDFLRIVVPRKHEQYAVSLWRRSQKKIGLWMQGQLMLSLLIAILAYLWLTVLGVPYALLIAVFVAIAELIPVFGSIAAAIPAAIVSFSAGGWTLVVLALGGYLVINQIQAHLIYPLVVKRVIGIPPVLVIIALIAGAELAGFLGVILSIPVAASIQELIADLEKRKSAAQREES